MKPKYIIYQEVLAAAERCSLPAPWTCLECHKAFVRLPADPDAMVAELRDKFDEPSLVAAGVLVKDGGGATVANPRLAACHDFVLALGQTKSSALLLAGLQALDGTPSAVAALENGLPTSLLECVQDRIFIVFSAADLAVLWSVGIPAIPATGLATLGGKELQTFRRLLRLRQRVEKRTRRGASRLMAPPPQPPVFPVLVNWSPATLSLADYPEALIVAEHFSKFVRCLNIDLSGGGIWKPTAGRLDRLTFGLIFGAPSDAFDVIRESSQVDRSPFFQDGSFAFPCSALTKTRNDWHAACDSGDFQWQSEAWMNLQQTHRAELILPLIKLAGTTDDPVAGNGLIALAEISDILHQKMTVVAARLSRLVQNHGFKAAGQLPREELREVETLTKAFLPLMKAAQCRTKKSKSASIPAILKGPSANLKGSA